MRLPSVAVLAIACSFGAWHSWKYRSLDHPPGILVTEAPEQVEVEDAPMITLGDTQLQKRARYRIQARLLSRKRYRLDAGASLAPLDFALGWGPMSDSRVLDQLDLSQSARFYHVRWQAPPMVPEELMRHAANLHLIPANSGVERRLDSMRPGQLIQLSGWLVDADRDDGWYWKTSLSREDSGPGACELMYVEQAEFLN